MLLILASFVVALLVMLYVRHRIKLGPMMELSEKIPGPKTLPLVGNALEFGFKTENIFDNMNRVIKEHGTITRVWLGNELMILMSDPKHVETILSSNKILDKAFLYAYLWPWLGDGLLTSTGEKWRVHRKLFTPTFHFKILEEFVEVFVRNEQIMTEHMQKHVDGPEFDIMPYVTRCALDIICETAMGVSVNAQKDSESAYVKAVRRMGDIIMQRGFNPFIQPDLLFHMTPLAKSQKLSLEILHGKTNSVIKARKQEYQQEKLKGNQNKESEDLGMKRRLAFLDLLIQAQQDGATLTDEQIREEVDTFMFEGHDTTTSGICYTYWALAKFQHVQEKAAQEVKQIFGNSDREITYNDLQEMKYIEQVIKESQRMYPTVPLFGRKLYENVQVDGYLLPEGSNIIIPTYMLHRNPDYFPDPERYDPDRFLPENCKGRHPYCYVPFSAGPRNCIGQKYAIMEMKVAICSLLRQYKLSLRDPAEELKFIAEMVMKSPNGINIKIERRNA